MAESMKDWPSLDNAIADQLLEKCRITDTSIIRDPRTKRISSIIHVLPESRQQWNRSSQVGQGSFGIVFMETLDGSNGKIIRAVKEIRNSDYDPNDIKTKLSIRCWDELRNMVLLSQVSNRQRFICIELI